MLCVERMSIQDISTVTPQQLINIRPVVASVKEFFWFITIVTVHGPKQPTW